MVQGTAEIPWLLAHMSAIQRPLVSSLVSDDTIFSPLTCRLAADPDKVDSPVRSDTEMHEPVLFLQRPFFALILSLTSQSGWRIEVKAGLILLYILKIPKTMESKHARYSQENFYFIGRIHVKITKFCTIKEGSKSILIKSNFCLGNATIGLPALNKFGLWQIFRSV